MVKKFNRPSVQICNRKQICKFFFRCWCNIHLVLCASAIFFIEEVITMILLERKFSKSTLSSILLFVFYLLRNHFNTTLEPEYESSCILKNPLNPNGQDYIGI